MAPSLVPVDRAGLPSGGRAGAAVRYGRVYLWTVDPSHLLGGRVTAMVVPLLRLDQDGEGSGRLWGRYVRVRNDGVVNRPDPATGSARPILIGEAKPNAEGDFLFEPRGGGGPLDEATFRDPDSQAGYVEATHFGEVNTYFHLDRIAVYVDDLLRELGAPPLPRVTAVVAAHTAVAEAEDGIRDGVRRRDRWVPFQGGHYRLPSHRYTDAWEYRPVSPEGEIHLGPGRSTLRFGALAEAARGPYQHNASHNGAILYHEYGHHINRHTADFRANALRPPHLQSNRKIPMDEGTCDYWTAAMLGTPHIWAWHRRHDDQEVHPRSLTSSKTMADYDRRPGADPHLNGTIWAAALWDLRTRLGETDPAGGQNTDLLVLHALRVLGQYGDPAPEAAADRTAGARESYAAGLTALLQADEQLNAGRNRTAIVAAFAKRGIEPTPSV